MKSLILDTIIIITLTCVLYHLTSRSEYERGFRDGFMSIPKPTPQHNITTLEKDKICSAWLFETNFKESKKRICGGKG